MNKIELSIVLPAFLEAENLQLLLPRLNDKLKQLTNNYEVLIIDTEVALDSTEEVCEKFNAKYVNRIYGNSYGSAIKTGIEKSQGIFTIFMDADGSHSPEFISKLYAKRDKGTIVIASRYVQGGYTDNRGLPIFMSKTLNKIYRVVLGLPYNDISNSFRLYDTNLLKELTLKSKNFDIIEEILYKIKKTTKRLQVIEIPYTFKKRMFGETKRNLLVFIFTFVVTLFRLRFMSLKK